jgi:hypothetical protein
MNNDEFSKFNTIAYLYCYQHDDGYRRGYKRIVTKPPIPYITKKCCLKKERCMLEYIGIKNVTGYNKMLFDQLKLDRLGGM